MQLKSILSSTLLAAAIGLVSANQVRAHAPANFLLPHHAFVTNAAFHANLIGATGLHLSGAQRSFNLINSAFSTAGAKAGFSAFSGGTIVGGTLTGTGYGQLTVGGPLLYGAQGSIQVGAGGGGPNTLTFINATPTIGIAPAPLSLNGFHLSGATRAFLTQNNASFAGGYNGAVRSFNGPITAGSLGGAGYLNMGGLTINTGRNFVFAFGKDPFNVLGIPGTPYTGSNLNYLTFANGLTKQISAGQLTVLSAVQTFPPSPQFAFFSPGAVGAFGADPFNNNILGGLLLNPRNYLLFFK
jgi:hypothetical protein